MTDVAWVLQRDALDRQTVFWHLTGADGDTVWPFLDFMIDAVDIQQLNAKTVEGRAYARIRWAPRDCRRQHEEVKELLKDVELSEDTMQALLALWEDLALAEAIQYARWALAKSGYNPEWSNLAIEGLRQALKHFSVSQVMYVIYLAMRSVSSTHQQGGVEAPRLGQVFASSITSFSQRAAVERWGIRGMSRPAELPLSTLATIFAHEVTRLDDEYLTRRPSATALQVAMTRYRTIH